MKVIPKHKTRKLWLLRWDKVKESPLVWGIMLVSLIVPLFCTCDYVNNICYGYIAGFIFYVLAQFLPETDEKLDAYQRILINMDGVVEYLGALESYLAPTKYKTAVEFAHGVPPRMVEGQIDGLSMVDSGSNRFVPLKHEVMQMIEGTRKRMADSINQLQVSEGKYVDAKIVFALRCINKLLEMSYVERGCFVSTNELFVVCEQYYTGQQMLQECSTALRRYQYVEEPQNSHKWNQQ